MVAQFDDDPIVLWPAPDLSILQGDRRPPPKLPLEAFGWAWAGWITQAALAAASPADYVVGPLLASASALMGNARWAQAAPGWSEPPHLWLGCVGDSGNGKTPSAACLMRSVLPEIERRMALDFPDKLREWQMQAELAKAKEEQWKSQVRDAEKKKAAPPSRPLGLEIAQEPQRPRLRQHDVTIEKVAMLLATAAPKGLLIVRNEFAGWIEGMNAYNNSGRSFWIESYDGHPYRVERQKHQQPIDVPRNVVAVCGGTQPDKLARLMQELDDGLMARILWLWPDAVDFYIGKHAPGADWAVGAFDKLRELDLSALDLAPSPIMVPLEPSAAPILEQFGREMQRRQRWASGLLRSAYGKARGQALRLSLVLEYLWWCAADGMAAPPTQISQPAMAAAIGLVGEYFMQMAERVYGDAVLPEEERLSATLARWLVSRHPLPTVINAREVRRLKLPGLREAEKVMVAIKGLIDADWLMPAPTRAGGSSGRQRADFAVNQRLKGAQTDD
jgi:Protein of unknown function (DUF3987)